MHIVFFLLSKLLTLCVRYFVETLPCDSGWPQSEEPPARASYMLELQACDTMLDIYSVYTVDITFLSFPFLFFSLLFLLTGFL